jgi:hypothetical protein
MALRKTLSALRTAVRDNLDEASPGFYTNAALNSWINRAKDRCFSEVRKAAQDFFVTTRSSTDGSLTILGESYSASSFAIAASTRDYTLPPDFIEMVAIEVITTGQEHLRFTFRPTTDPQFRALLAQTTAEQPNGFLYTIFGERTMRIAPMTDTALDLRLSYVYVVPDLSSDSDTLDMPYPLYQAVEEYATAYALMSDRAPEAAAHEARGNSTVARFLATATRQSTEPVYVQGYLEDY